MYQWSFSATLLGYLIVSDIFLNNVLTGLTSLLSFLQNSLEEYFRSVININPTIVIDLITATIIIICHLAELPLNTYEH